MRRWCAGGRDARLRAALVVSVLGLGACSGDQATLLSESARSLALREQETVRLDAALAKDYQDLLDVVWSEFPGLRCARVRVDAHPNQLLVGNPPDAATEAWRAGQVETGLRELDAFFASYGFYDVVTYESFPWPGPLVTSESLNMRNLAVIANAQFPGLEAEPVELEGGGDDLRIEGVDGETPVVTVEHGWGDCLAGCLHRHEWRIEVNRTTGEATLVGESGDPIDDGHVWCPPKDA